MSDALVGTSTVRELQILVADAPYLAATVTYSLTGPTGTLLLNGVSAPHVGDGWYQVLLTGAQLATAGTYTEQWVGTAASATLQRDGVFMVLPPRGPLLTRLELRQQLADELGDLVTGTLTGASAGSLTDSERIETANYWAGAWFTITSGNARNQERRLTTSDPTGLLTVGKPWSVTPGVGDYYEGHRAYPVATYNRALNRAILDGVDDALIEVTSEVLVEAASTYEVVVPAGFVFLADAALQSSASAGTTQWLPLRWGTDWALRSGRRLWLPNPTAGARLRLHGQMRPELLQRDGAYVDVRPEYLLYQAAAHLLTRRLGGPATDPDNTSQRVDRYLKLAADHAPADLPLPNSRRVA